MISEIKLSNIDVIIKVNGEDVKLCVGYWVDFWDCHIIETINDLPSTMFLQRVIDKIIEKIVNQD